MYLEIERKFLLRNDGWRGLAVGVPFRQGYLQTTPCAVRVRTEGKRGVLTIKGPAHNCSRAEFEYEIPLDDANTLLDTLALRP
ncbi:MAG: CYTH domain-containing protein, partial [Bilophila sp.]